MLSIIPVYDLTTDEDQQSTSSSSSSIFSSATVGDYESATSVESSTSPEIKILETKPRPIVSKFLKYENSKTVFVEALVGSAVLLVDAIWKTPGGSSKKSMPLRRFIQETLKRSRTSYSTFQVSLYYLILVKPFIFEQAKQGRLSKSPLSCARRTFLASLMLASKCLQDRNYSISAWSKISGLSVKELGNNEIEFLKASNWKLHVPQDIYNRWSTLLLYSASVKPETWKNRIRSIGPDICLDESNSLSNDEWDDFIDLTGAEEERTGSCSTVSCSDSATTPPIVLECQLPLTPGPQGSRCTSPETGGYYMTNKDEWRYIRSSLAIQQKLQNSIKSMHAKQRSAVAAVLATPTPSEVRQEKKRSLDDDCEGITILNVRPVKQQRRLSVEVIHVDDII